MTEPKKKLLVLTSTFPRWQNDTQPVFIHRLCQELLHDYEVDVLCPHYPGLLQTESIGKLRVFRFRYFFERYETLTYGKAMLANLKENQANILLVPFFLFFQIYHIVRLYRTNNYDLIHAHWIIPQGFCVTAVKLLLFRRMKILLTSHGADLYALQGRLLSRIKKMVLDSCNFITVVSETMAEELKKYRISENKIAVSSMGIDLANQFVSTRDHLNREGLIFVGRLEEKKGVEYLIRSISILKADNIKVRLTVVGDGTQRRHLEDLVKRLQLESEIHFTGSIPNTDIPDYLNKAAIFVMPSIIASDGDQEGLGLVAVEAMGCQCAVIASGLDAIRDVVKDNVTGLLVEPKNEKAIAAAIRRLIKDAALAQRIAEAGRNYVLKNYDWKIVGQKYSAIIAQVIAAQ